MKPVIFGCAGTQLTAEEQDFFTKENPMGFILFARNIQDHQQVKNLTKQLRDTVGRPDAPILIDQEGGRVQRLVPPLWRSFMPMADFGKLWKQDRSAALHAAWLQARIIAQDLIELGINVNCAPVLDVPVANAHDVIGNRAFSLEPSIVAELGQAYCQGHLESGVMPIIKHIPGHGRAMADSHLELPVVTTDLETLKQSDFAPFQQLSGQGWAMTAHVVYQAIDTLPATTSSKLIKEIIRDHIGFQGILLSDDLSMQALSGSFADRTRNTLAAGCDVVLHCNGNMAEMAEIAGAMMPASSELGRKYAQILTTTQKNMPIDRETHFKKLTSMLQRAA